MSAPATPRWDLDDMPDLTGQTWLVTGSTNGLGLETVRVASSRGARIILAVRNEALGQKVASQLGDADVLRVDFSSQASVQSAANQVTEQVDVLINNAGAATNSRQVSEDGFENNLAVNLFGPFRFTNLVLPRVKRRVVVVGSMAHKQATFDLDDPHFERRKWTKPAAYGQSKLGDMIWGAELSRRIHALRPGVDVQLSHPGWAATSLTNPTPSKALNRLFDVGVAMLGQPPTKGALTTLYAATEVLPNNSYIGPDRLYEFRGHPKPVGRTKEASDPRLAAHLWDLVDHATSTADVVETKP